MVGASCARVILHWVWIAAGLWGSSAAATAAAPTSGFDPDRELAGFADMREWTQAYYLRPFFARSGKEISPEERADLLRQWEALKPRIEARHAEAGRDAFIDAIDHVINGVAHLPFFETLHYRVIETTRPYALFVEVPGKSDADDAIYVRRVEEAYSPFLSAFLKKLDDEIAPLVGKEPGKTSFVVWVLRSRASYESFCRQIDRREAPAGQRAHYSSNQRWAYTWSTDFHGGSEFLEGVHVLLHELVHAYVDRLAPKGIESVQSHWINEGLAEYLSFWQRRDAKNVYFEPRWSDRIIEVLHGLSTVSGDLRIKVADMVTIKDARELYDLAIDVANERTGSAPAEVVGYLQSRFYADAYLLILWLHETEGGRYRANLWKFIGQELQGNGGEAALAALLGDAMKLPVDSELTLYARELMEGRLPWSTGQPAAPGSADGSAPGGASSAPHATVRSVSGLACATKLPELIPRALRWREFILHGYRDAATLFRDAKGLEGDAALATLVEGEIERLLTRLRSSHEVVTLDDNVKGQVVEVRADTVVIGSKERRTDVARRTIAPQRLSFLLRKGGDKEDGVRVASAVLEVLSGNAKGARDVVRKVTKDPTDALQGFMREADSVAAEVDALGVLDAVLMSPDTAALESQLRARWPAIKATKVATTVREELRELLAERLAPTIPPVDAVRGQVHCKVEIAPSSVPSAGVNDAGSLSVELTYEFDRAEEALDFPAQPWPKEFNDQPEPRSRQRKEKAQTRVLPSKPWRLAGGMLQPDPSGFCVHPVIFGNSMEVELTTKLPEDATLEQFEAASLQFGLRGNGGSDYVIAMQQTTLFVLNMGRWADAAAVVKPLILGESLTSKLTVGGREVTFLRAEAAPAKLPFAFTGTGQFILAGIGERMWQIERLRLRGQLSPEALLQMQKAAAVSRAAEIVGE